MVTIADIKAFGMNHFKSLLTGTEVQKGTKEASLKGGFRETIDLFLLNQEQMEKLSPSEWQYLASFYKTKNASANIYPYHYLKNK